MLGQERTERFGKFFQKSALIFFRWFYLGTVWQISDIILTIEVLKKHDEVRLCMRITSYMGVKVTVAHAVIKSVGIYAKLFFYL